MTEARRAGGKSGAEMWSLGGGSDSIRGELRPLEATRRLSDLVLEDGMLDALRRVLREQQRSRELYAHGFAPTRRMLLHGPPGCGKTSIAEALACEAGFPLVRVDPAMIVRSHLGETGKRIADLFSAMEQVPGLWLFDEIDAIATARGGAGDMTEMTRAVVAMLTGLERWTGVGMVVACTNLPDKLDRALWRRFDAVLELTAPSPMHLVRIARRSCGKLDTKAVDWHEVEGALRGRSPADVETAVKRAAVDVILDGRAALTTAELITALRARHLA